MARDYQTRKYIIEQSSLYNDQRLSDVLVKAFDLICNKKEPDGCLSNSVALHVILRSYGYDPKLCYGLCVTPAGDEIYHAWLELDEKVIDLAIYGNAHFGPYWRENPLPPVILEDKQTTMIRYGDHVFDDDWERCLISRAINMGPIANYIAGAPRVKHPSGNGMWRLIFMILDETYTKEKREVLERFVSKEAF